MPRPTRNPRDRLFTILAAIERRLSRLESPSRNFASLNLAPDATGSSSSASYTRAVAGLGAGTYSRLAYAFIYSTDAGEAGVRIVARNGTDTVELATFTTSSSTGVWRLGNVAIPETVQDGGPWTFEIQGRVNSGAGPYHVTGYALLLTNDPNLIPVQPS